MPKLNKSTIDRLPIPAPVNGKSTQVFHRDDALPCFGLRIGSGGTKAFFVEKRIDNKVKRITLGRYGQITPEKARLKAMELLSDITFGKDPAAEKKQAAKRQAYTAVTLENAFESYLKSRKDLKAGTIANYRKCVDGCLNDWKNCRLLDITKDMVEERHHTLGQRAPARANNTMRVLRAIFNHAIERYEDDQGRPFIPFNPVDRLSHNRAWYRVERRSGHLKPHQLKAWLTATQALHQSTTRDFLQLLLFTGLRKNEAATLRWSDIDLSHRTLTVQDTKNRDLHTLPLPDYLYTMLSARKLETVNEWVFPSPREDGPLKEPRSAIKRVIELSGIAFTLHDLRRTFITIAEGLDISAYALKRLANHRLTNDITAGYIISDVERLREPMNRIEAFIKRHSA